MARERENRGEGGRRQRPSILRILIALGVLGLIVWLFLNFAPEPIEQEQPRSETPEEAAEQALKIFPQLVNQENFAALGFRSPEEVQGAELGEPLPLYFVPLDKLQTYEGGQGLERELVVDAQTVVFPVLLNQSPRSSIFVQGNAQGWLASDFGGATLIRSVSEFRRGGEEFLLQIPALNLYFLGQFGEELLLTPIAEDPRFQFFPGRTLTADQVFETLKPATQDLGEFPT